MGFPAIINPIPQKPIFPGLTADGPSAVKKKVAEKSLLTAFILIVIFALLGTSLPAFRIMGIILDANGDELLIAGVVGAIKANLS